MCVCVRACVRACVLGEVSACVCVCVCWGRLVCAGGICVKGGEGDKMIVLQSLFLPVLHTVESLLPLLRVTTVTCPVHTLSSSAVGSRRVWL